jgi:hypothetical protein
MSQEPPEDELTEAEELEQRIEARASAEEFVKEQVIDLSEIDIDTPQPWTLNQMAHQGSRVLIPGPTSEGKSLFALMAACDVAGRGDEVYVLDVENGPVRTAKRRATILADRTDAEAAAARKHLHYIWNFNFSALDEFPLSAVWLSRLQGSSLVVVDSLPKYFGRLGLDENSASATSKFMTYIDRIAENERTTVLMLDNTGHSGDRSRGSSAKEGMADTVYAIGGGQTCREDKHGTITLRNKKHRDGDEADVLTVGAGAGSYTSLEANTHDAELLKKVLKLLTSTPQSKNWVYAQVKEAKVGVRKQDLYRLLDEWAQDPYSGVLESDDLRFGLDV